MNLSQFYLEPDVRHSKSDEDDDADNVDDNHSEGSSGDGHVDNSGPIRKYIHCPVFDGLVLQPHVYYLMILFYKSQNDGLVLHPPL